MCWCCCVDHEPETYHDDDEIKPTPSICEIFGKSKRQPFDQHFEQEDYCEEFVHIAKILHK